MKILMLFLAPILASATAFADDAGRQQKIAKIIEAQGLRKTFAQTLEQSKTASIEVGRKIFDKTIADAGFADAEGDPVIRQIFERYIEGCASIWTADRLVALWAEHYGKHLSDDDLDKILAYYVSDTGQKDVSAAQAATASFVQAKLEGEGKRLEVLNAALASELKKAADEQVRKHVPAEAEKAVNQIKAEAAKNYPDLPAAEAQALQSRQHMTAKLANEGDPRKRKGSAASAFLGFFLANTRERSAYCREQGIDIQPFVAAFERAHAKEVDKARSILAELKIDDEQLYALIKPQLRRMITEDMEQIASANSTSLGAACEFIAHNGEALTAQMQFALTQPEVHRVLLSGQ